jgi:hypothetical protein
MLVALKALDMAQILPLLVTKARVVILLLTLLGSCFLSSFPDLPDEV